MAPLATIAQFSQTTALEPQGVEFVDRRTGLRCIIDSPASRPHLWDAYLEGVARAYRSWGVEEAFNRAEVESGTSTNLFCVVLDDDGDVVAGHRVQGPYLAATQSHALEEWDGQPGLPPLTQAIEERLEGGLVEVKSAYVALRDERADGVANLLSRVGLIVTELTGARYMMATAAEHVLKRWSQGGGRIDRSVPAAPYPDERYRTQVMFWDRDRMHSDADPRLWPLMLLEYQTAFGETERAVG
jgi:hypothetical protein